MASKKKKKTALYFTTVCAYPGDAVALGGHLHLEGSDPVGTRLMQINKGAWGFLADVPEVVHAIILRIAPGDTKRRRCVLGRDGRYREYIFGGAVRDVPIAPKDMGYMEHLAIIEGDVYGCGAQGRVYRLAGSKWKAIDAGPRIAFDGEDVKRMLLSISGFSSKNIYTCGFEGEIWHSDGTTWRELDSPTNFPLQSVLCAPDGRAYFCGAGGHLMSLQPDGSWLDLSKGELGEGTLWDMTCFVGRVHIAAEKRVLVVDGEGVRALPKPSSGTLHAMALDASEDRLWCVGGDDVFSFDGRHWTRFVCPEN